MSDWNEEVTRYKVAKAMPSDQLRLAPGKSKKKVDKPFAVAWRGRPTWRFATAADAIKQRDKLRRNCGFISPRWTGEQVAEQRKRAEKWAQEYTAVDADGRVIE